MDGNTPFLWGRGGHRLTPEDISRERAIAASLMQSDYSPIQSPWQGLARVSGNVLGALHERRAEHAYDANQADQSRLIASLLGGGDTAGAAGGMPAPIPGGMAAPDPTATPPAAPLSQLGSSPPGVAPTPPGGGTGMPSLNPAIAAALSDPYADSSVKALALQQYRDATKHAQPIEVGGKLVDPTTMQVLGDFSAPPQIVQLMKAAGIDPNSDQGHALALQAAQNTADPVVTVMTPGGFMAVPRSQLANGGGMAAPQPERPPIGAVIPDPRGGGAGPQTPQTFPMSALDNATMLGESSGNRFGPGGGLLTSPAGAMGEMQVMPDTARQPGYGVRPWDGTSPDDLARVGRDYRGAMQQHFGGDLAKMWAAYNWGPARVDAAIQRHGARWLDAAPQGVRDYIARNFRHLGAQ
jgi:soluble lytic murein transglycosylase